MAHNLARWTARLGLGERIVTTKTLRRRFFSMAGRASPARHAASPCIFRNAGPGRRSSAAPSPGYKRFHTQSDGNPLPLNHQPANQTSLQTRASPVSERPLLRPILPSRPARRLQTAFNTPSDCGLLPTSVLL